jgi:hypothetical protein
MSQITLNDFPARALAEFPELPEEFAGDEGLPYVQMGAFARLMQRAKGSGNWDTYRRAARFADELWGGADPGLRNALNVSLLEHIDFDGPRGSDAWSLLSPRLRRAWREMDAYNQWLRSGAKGEPPALADG